MRVKRRFSTRWGHPYHLPGACAKCRQTRLRPRCFIPSMIPETYMEWPAQNKGEDPPELTLTHLELLKDGLPGVPRVAVLQGLAPYGGAIQRMMEGAPRRL